MSPFLLHRPAFLPVLIQTESQVCVLYPQRTSFPTPDSTSKQTCKLVLSTLEEWASVGKMENMGCHVLVNSLASPSGQIMLKPSRQTHPSVKTRARVICLQMQNTCPFPSIWYPKRPSSFLSWWKRSSVFDCSVVARMILSSLAVLHCADLKCWMVNIKKASCNPWTMAES